MYVYHEATNYPPRQHPWVNSKHDSRAQYYDFKSYPELIEDSLEDLRPLKRTASAREIIKAIKSINTYSSVFETNDFMLRGPEVNESAQFNKKLQVVGRLTLFYEDLARNCDPTSINILAHELFKLLGTASQAFKFGCIGISQWATLFTNISEEGNILVLRFWAWGDTTDETLQNLELVFKTLNKAVKALNDSHI